MNKFYAKYLKRFFDFILSLLGIIILLPLFLILMFITWCCNGNGIFFKQSRPGKNGKLFTLVKFRSMNNKKDENGNLLPDKDRVTAWGRFLRKTSLDELPQLFNILKGDMAIVGPRPRLVKDMVFYPEEYFDNYTIRPGLTGKTQVNGHNHNTWEKVFEMDKDYKNHITFWGDVKLIFQTFTTIFFKKNQGSVDGSAQNHQAYYYADYLLQSEQITKEVYDLGLTIADDIIKKHEIVTFQKQLVRVAKENDNLNITQGIENLNLHNNDKVASSDMPSAV